MKISYKYCNKICADIRDIVFNNKLKPDFQYILEEYIPFQIFITGRTFFRGVEIIIDTPYEPENQDRLNCPPHQFILDSFDKKEFDHEVAAVSGGIDSSTMSMIYKPSLIYTGYYDGDERYNETVPAGIIGDLIGARHLKIKLTEQDFLDNIYKVMDVFCLPIGGLGPLMEYVLLKKVIEEVGTVDTVLFGHGGDEIFLGYFFDQFVRSFYHSAIQSSRYMPTFMPSISKGIEGIVDLMIIALLNRAGRKTFGSEFITKVLEPYLFSMPNIVDKLLYVSINWVLPSLLHLNQQFCRSLGVTSCTPLANAALIRHARALNSPMSEIPKQVLRDMEVGVPREILDNYKKNGFQIPMDTWNGASELIEGEYNNFVNRRIPNYYANCYLPEYTELNRYTWAVAQAEMYLTRFCGR